MSDEIEMKSREQGKLTVLGALSLLSLLELKKFVFKRPIRDSCHLS